MSSRDSLSTLLVRIQGKIEVRTRRPWFDLQRPYYFKDSKSIKDVQELRIALERFHVMLSDAELAQLFEAFSQGPNSCFDFRAFAERCYPREAAAPSSLNKSAQLDSTPSAAAAASSSPNGTQQQSDEYRPSSSYSQRGEQQQQQHYKESQQLSQRQLQQQHQYDETQHDVHHFALTQGGQRPQSQQGYSADPYGQGAATQQQQQQQQGQSHLSPQGQSRTTSRTSSQGKFKARLTYNRPHHARYNEAPYSGPTPSTAVPRAAPYPAQELASPPRFVTRPTTRAGEGVDVPRRHNISRQYSRDGSAPSAGSPSAATAGRR